MAEVFKLALPVVLSFLGAMLMGFVDMIAVGRVSAEAVGAVGVGNSVFFWLMMLGIGVLSGLDYTVSYHFGRGDRAACRTQLGQGLILAAILSVIVTVLLLVASWQLHVFHVNPDVLPLARSYTHIIGYSMAPMLIFTAFRQYLQATGRAIAPMVILLLANCLNGAGNYAFVLGNWGMPALGSDGSAWTSLASRVFMMVAAGFHVLWNEKGEEFGGWWRIRKQEIQRLVRLGVPASLQMMFEVGVFSLSTLLASRLAAAEMAAHQIVLNLASMAFMVPLGIGTATAVLVGRSLGKDDQPGAFKTGWLGFKLAMGFMSFSCLLMLSFPQHLLSIFGVDSEVTAIAASLLLVAALFQLSDGAQVVMTGALRGLADTKSAMIANFVGHWIIGLPISIGLCFFAGWGVLGLWVGLSLGLTTVAAALIWRWSRRGSLHSVLNRKA